MTGPRYITDSKGRRTAVVLSIRESNQLLEDSHDLSEVARRRAETPISFEELERRLIANGTLSGPVQPDD